MFRVERIRVLFAFVVVKGCVAIEALPLFPEALGGGVVDVFGITDGFETQRTPTGKVAEVFGEGFGVFDGVDYDGVGVLAAEVAGVHEVGHEPVACLLLAQVRIEAAFRIFDVVAQLEMSVEHRQCSAPRGDAPRPSGRRATPLRVFVSRFAQGSPTKSPKSARIKGLRSSTLRISDIRCRAIVSFLPTIKMNSSGCRPIAKSNSL